MLWQWVPVTIAMDLEQTSMDSRGLEVFIFELEGVGVAKLPEDLPSGLVPPTLDEQLVQK